MSKPERLTIGAMEKLAVLEYSVAQLAKQVRAVVRSPKGGDRMSKTTTTTTQTPASTPEPAKPSTTTTTTTEQVPAKPQTVRDLVEATERPKIVTPE